MDFTDLVQKRFSARSYLPDPVEEDKLQAILQAARLAPTAANRQPFQVIVIHTRSREEELAAIYHRPWFVQAPLVLAVCIEHSQSWVRAADSTSYAYVDAAIILDHILLAATDLGLGTCWVANFNPLAARQVLGLPDGVDPVGFTPLGYTPEQAGPKKRKELSELVRYERW